MAKLTKHFIETEIRYQNLDSSAARHLCYTHRLCWRKLVVVHTQAHFKDALKRKFFQCLGMVTIFLMLRMAFIVAMRVYTYNVNQTVDTYDFADVNFANLLTYASLCLPLIILLSLWSTRHLAVKLLNLLLFLTVLIELPIAVGWVMSQDKSSPLRTTLLRKVQIGERKVLAYKDGFDDTIFVDEEITVFRIFVARRRLTEGWHCKDVKIEALNENNVLLKFIFWTNGESSSVMGINL